MAQDPQRWLETGSGERYTDFIDGAGVFVRETPQGVAVTFDPTLGFFSGDHDDLTDDVQGAADQDNSGDTFIQDVTVDDHGHVTALTAAAASSSSSGWNRYHREGTLEDGVTYTDEYIDGLEAATDEDIEIRNPFFNLVGTFDGSASDYQVNLMEVNGGASYSYNGETFIRDDVVQLTASAPSSTGPALNIRLTKSQSASQQVWFGFEWRRV